MTARGPTFLDDETLTGSVHVLDLPDPVAARAFAFEEPCYQAGAYRDVLLRRWHNALGRRPWNPPPTQLPRRPATTSSRVVCCSPTTVESVLEAIDEASARQILSANRYSGIEVHRWDFGGRPA